MVYSPWGCEESDMTEQLSTLACALWFQREHGPTDTLTLDFQHAKL